MFLFKSKKKDSKPKTYEDTLNKEVRIFDELISDREKMVEGRKADLEWLKVFMEEDKVLLEERSALLKEYSDKLQLSERMAFVSKWVFDQSMKDSYEYEKRYGRGAPEFQLDYYSCRDIHKSIQEHVDELTRRIESTEKQIGLCQKDIALNEEEIEKGRDLIEIEVVERDAAIKAIAEEKEFQKQVEDVSNMIGKR